MALAWNDIQEGAALPALHDWPYLDGLVLGQANHYEREGQLAEAEDPKAFRDELMARIESARGPVGPLNRFQIEEMIDPRDTRRYICDWVTLAYRVVSQPSRLAPRALQFRP